MYHIYNYQIIISEIGVNGVRKFQNFTTIHLFQISRDNWLTEKVSGSLFSCQVQSLFVSSKLKCTVIQGGFSIVKFIKKVCETI